MKLYDRGPSGNCHKVRLLLSMLGLEYEKESVDLGKEENRRPEFLRLNPRGQVPTLTDGDVTVWDSQAILVYLARRYGGEEWLPTEAVAMAEVMQWLAMSENEFLFGLARARQNKKMNGPWPWDLTSALARSGLAVINDQLEEHDWLALGRPTIADLACYPYVALAHEGEISLDDYPAVRAWMARIRALPGYVGMPGIGD
ncbi:MAG: glutathione S-transferase family protein [Rhodospirillales bacterium]|nr:glutathione S-transferase family protein [Rhodospirillales bacterium]